MDRTRKAIFPFDESLIAVADVTSSTTVAPAGIDTPLLPTIGSESCATNLSPGFADVQTLLFTDASAVVPSRITPVVGAVTGGVTAGVGTGIISGSTVLGGVCCGGGTLSRGVCFAGSATRGGGI